MSIRPNYAPNSDATAVDRASTLFEPARLGPLTLRNRVIKAATFEGMTPDGVVTDELIRFHSRVAAGGAAMTTIRICPSRPRGAPTPVASSWSQERSKGSGG